MQNQESNNNNVVIIMTNRNGIAKKSLFKSSYLYRDLCVWLFFLIILPLILFSLYYMTTTTASSSNIDVTEKLEHTNVNEYESILKRFNEERQLLTPIDSNDFTFEQEKFRPMKKISLKKYKNALCNDGSVANFYLRLSDTNSKQWLILIEGGYFCYDDFTCNQRYFNSFNLTSSTNNEMFKYGTGILSSSKVENKYWSNANIVLVFFIKILTASKI
jgi:hypothetical protein